MAALQGRRNNLQHQDSSSDAAPLPDACFAPVSREGLHFLVGEPGESCIETCERAGYGTMDSGYGAFSGGDGMDGLVLCRVEVDGATRFFGWQNATGGPCAYVDASGAVTRAHTPAFPASPAAGPSCACLALPLEELSWERGLACPNGSVPVAEHPRICRTAMLDAQGAAAELRLGWLKSDTCLSAPAATGGASEGSSSGAATAVAAGGGAGLGMEVLCQPQLEMDPDLLPASPGAPNCTTLQPVWPLPPGSSAVAWLEAEGGDCPATCLRHGFSQGEGDLGAVGVSGLSLCRLDNPVPGGVGAQAGVAYGLSRTERPQCDTLEAHWGDDPEQPASFQCACLRIPRQRLFWSPAGNGCPRGATPAVPEAQVCRVEATAQMASDSIWPEITLGLLQPNGCQPVGSSSAQGLDSSMPELVQFSGGGGVSVLCYSLA